MPITDRSAADAFTLGERWRQLAYRKTHRPLPAQGWLVFANLVQHRYAGTFARQSLAQALHERQQDGEYEPENQHLSSSLFGAKRPTHDSVDRYPEQRNSNLQAWKDPQIESQETTGTRSLVIDEHHTSPSLSQLPSGMLRQPSETLDARMESRLKSVLDMRIPSVSIYTNQAADTIARRFDADAVSYGSHILFRAGKYAPHTPTGFALLGHELTHAAGERLADHAPQTHKEMAAEETVALRNEHKILNHVSFSSLPPSVPNDLRFTTPKNASPSEPTPRTASSDRHIDFSGSQEPAASSLLPEQQLRHIKEEVYRDLMDRLRTEFERGA